LTQLPAEIVAHCISPERAFRSPSIVPHSTERSQRLAGRIADFSERRK